ATQLPLGPGEPRLHGPERAPEFFRRLPEDATLQLAQHKHAAHALREPVDARVDVRGEVRDDGPVRRAGARVDRFPFTIDLGWCSRPAAQQGETRADRDPV